MGLVHLSAFQMDDLKLQMDRREKWKVVQTKNIEI